MQQHRFHGVSGRLPLVWDRHYTSHEAARRAGVGWHAG
ncbi:hypothetical protein AAFM48_16890 [Burkholderia pseudomallei]